MRSLVGDEAGGGAGLEHGWGEPPRWLREAGSYFDARGDTSIPRAWRSILRHAGAPVSRRGRGESTVRAPRAVRDHSREMDVLALVAEGLSNQGIGERLYLSPRTVENHVRSLLAKTGTKDRSALAALTGSNDHSKPQSTR